MKETFVVSSFVAIGACSFPKRVFLIGGISPEYGPALGPGEACTVEHGTSGPGNGTDGGRGGAVGEAGAVGDGGQRDVRMWSKKP